MIYYDFITIILFFIIFILILKFKDYRIDNFYSLDVLNTSNTFNISDCENNQNDSLDCNILRIMSDRRVNNHILNLLKQSTNENDRKNMVEQNKQIDEFIKKTEENKETIDKILFKLRKIDNHTDQKMSSYIEEKIKRDNNLIELTDLLQPTESRKFLLSNDEFEDKNTLIKNKLAKYYDIAKNINKKETNKNEKILILKNFGNNKELNLIDVNQSLKMYNESKNLDSKIYQLFLNDNCVNFSDKNTYKLENCIEDEGFFYTVNKILDFGGYNEFIKYSKSSKDFHEVDKNSKNIIYPFYIICPLKNYSLCLTYSDDKVSFQDIRNNSNQRFKKVLNSNYCSYD